VQIEEEQPSTIYDSEMLTSEWGMSMGMRWENDYPCIIPWKYQFIDYLLPCSRQRGNGGSDAGKETLSNFEKRFVRTGQIASLSAGDRPKDGCFKKMHIRDQPHTGRGFYKYCLIRF
jgi:hypothetical protein